MLVSDSHTDTDVRNEGPESVSLWKADNGSVRYWYAVCTKPHHERRAELNLLRLGVETFNPQLKERKVIRRVRRVVTVPLFPGYLFAKLDLDNQFRAVSYAKGVRRIVAFGSTPAKVDDELIEAIKVRLINGEVIAPARVLKAGQTVKIQDGPLGGLHAIFEREMTGQQRAVLLLRTLAYQARVVVPLEQVVNL
jgi:transcriptional antiterminator RfaH